MTRDTMQQSGFAAPKKETLSLLLVVGASQENHLEDGAQLRVIKPSTNRLEQICDPRASHVRAAGRGKPNVFL